MEDMKQTMQITHYTYMWQNDKVNLYHLALHCIKEAAEKRGFKKKVVWGNLEKRRNLHAGCTSNSVHARQWFRWRWSCQRSPAWLKSSRQHKMKKIGTVDSGLHPTGYMSACMICVPCHQDGTFSTGIMHRSFNWWGRGVILPKSTF